MATTTRPAPTRCHEYVFDNGVHVVATAGSLINTTVPVIVTSVDLEKATQYSPQGLCGRTDEEVRKALGYDLQDSRRGAQQKRGGHKTPIPVFCASHSKFKAVVHVCLPAYSAAHTTEEAIAIVQKQYDLVFEWANTEHVPQIAFTMLGMGAAKFPHDVCIQAAIRAISNIVSNSNGESCVSRVVLATGNSSQKFEEIARALFVASNWRMKVRHHPNLHAPVPCIDNSIQSAFNKIQPHQNRTLSATDVGVPSGIAVRVENIFSAEEVGALLEIVKSQLDFKSVEWEYDSSYRQCERAQIDSPFLSALLHSRLLPSHQQQNQQNQALQTRHLENLRPFGFGNEGTWTPTHINPRFRFSRYNTGGKFAPHRDGSFVENDDVRSVLSIVCYLTTAEDGKTFEGGETVFYCEKGVNDNTKGVVKARAGDGVVFTHDVWHEGMPVTNVVAEMKYIFRTDIMFRRIDTAKINATPANFMNNPIFVEMCRLFTESIDLQAAGDPKTSTEKYLQALEMQAQLPSTSHVTPVHDIPADVWHLVFKMLHNPRDIVACSAVCKSWRSIARSNEVWKPLFEKWWHSASDGVSALSVAAQNENPQAGNTVYDMRESQSSLNLAMDSSTVWWRSFQYRFNAENKFRVVIAQITPDTIRFGSISHHVQVNPVNRGSWGGDLRAPSSDFRAKIPHKVARSQGHYWSAASGFKSFFVGNEVGRGGWFGEDSAVRAIDSFGTVNLLILHVVLRWVVMFGMAVRLQPQEHPLCVVLPACVGAFAEARKAIFETIRKDIRAPYALLLDASVAVANSHACSDAIVVECGKEYTWIVPVVQNCARYSHAALFVVCAQDDGGKAEAYFGGSNKAVASKDPTTNLGALIVQVCTDVGGDVHKLVSNVVVSSGNDTLASTEFLEFLQAQVVAEAVAANIGVKQVKVHAPTPYDAVDGAEALCSFPGSRELFKRADPLAGVFDTKLDLLHPTENDMGWGSIVFSDSALHERGWDQNVTAPIPALD